MLHHVWLSCLLAAITSAQSDSAGTVSGTQSLVTLTGSETLSTSSFTGSYSTGTDQSTASSGAAVVVLAGSSSSSGNSTGSMTTTTTSQGTTSIATLLLGGGVGLETLSIINGTTTIFPNSTASATRTGGAAGTATSAQATNTQACNNYPEFCSRKYSNITEVCAHNSAFHVTGNAASNQALSITNQLDDGIRMIQGETHYVNDTIYSCHTSCDLLNAGTFQSELETVAAWVRDHTYDVVTILIVNSDYVSVDKYIEPIQNSGLAQYLYVPPYVPMHLDQWPTLSEMILTQKRVVIMMDYNANQTAVPYILDEFSHMFETPFSPQNRSFPCNVDRPPTLTNLTRAKDEYMYLANHNLNQDISLAGFSLLLPNTAELNITNADGTDEGMLGAMSDTCMSDWERPPNFLLVDYYNIGNGSVFEVAAKANGVTYNRKCCGVSTTSAGSVTKASALLILSALAVAMMMI